MSSINDDFRGTTPQKHNGFPMLGRCHDKSVRESSESITPTYSPLLKHPPFGIGLGGVAAMAALLRVDKQKIYEALLEAEEVEKGRKSGQR